MRVWDLRTAVLMYPARIFAVGLALCSSGNIGKLEEVAPRMDPAEGRLDHALGPAGLVELVISAIGVGLQDAFWGCSPRRSRE
jgi:hypothetical protein